jgi:hypothetical protein
MLSSAKAGFGVGDWRPGTRKHRKKDGDKPKRSTLALSVSFNTLDAFELVRRKIEVRSNWSIAL